jgi:hypothetical protein
MSNDKIQMTNVIQNSNIKFQNFSFGIWNFTFAFLPAGRDLFLDFEF